MHKAYDTILYIDYYFLLFFIKVCLTANDAIFFIPS